MKLIEMSCPHCGAELKIDSERKRAVCEYCGAAVLLENEDQQALYDNAEEAGYRFEKGRQRAKEEATRKKVRNSEQHRREAPVHYQPKKKKRRTWLWILGWIFIFPLPLMLLLFRKKDMNWFFRFGIIAAAWVVYFAIGISGRNGVQERKTSPPVSETSKVSTEKSDIPEQENSVASEGHEDSSQKSEAAQTIERIVEEAKVEQNQPETATELSESEAANTFIIENHDSDNTDITGRRNESLKGRGRADSGRSEPQYVGIIGYAAVNSVQEYVIEKSDNFQDTGLWKVPTYEQDRQFWNETDTTLPHKTEVVVLDQILEHKGWGSYTGYLLVQRTDDSSEHYIDVSNFVTRPYWKDQDDLKKAALDGDMVAEYHQTSDYWPVDSGNDKLDIPDGTMVLITGITGSGSRFDSEQTDIEAIVWKEWKKGYGGVKCHFNHKDLTILY